MRPLLQQVGKLLVPFSQGGQTPDILTPTVLAADGQFCRRCVMSSAAEESSKAVVRLRAQCQNRHRQQLPPRKPELEQARMQARMQAGLQLPVEVNWRRRSSRKNPQRLEPKLDSMV